VKKFLLILGLFGLLGQAVFAQLPAYPYPDFVPGSIISSAEVNSNFSLVADNALKRNGGGVIEGHLTLNADITLDGVDIGDYLLSSGHIRATVTGNAAAPAFALTSESTTGLFFGTGAIHFSLSGAEQGKLDSTGLTVRGTNIFNSSGKVPALSATYFVSLANQDLQPAETSFADGLVLPRLAADETITGTYTFSGALRHQATWNNSGVIFTGVSVSITNTASAAASKLIDVKVGGSSKLHTLVGGKTVVETLKITGGARADYFLVGNAAGVGTWQPSATAAPVPTGMLAFFEAACPTGWTIKSDAANTYNARFIRGGGTFVASGGADTHTHSLDPPSTTGTDNSVNHTHSVDPANTGTTNAGGHGHSITGSTASALGLHTHNFTTDLSAGSVGITTVPNNTTGALPSHSHSGTTDATNIAHTHTSGSLAAVGVGDHSHSIDMGATTSGVGSVNHQHSVDIASFTSASASNVPAYVQVVVCRKD
jgi:hypothetical protein